jgi:ubiquinone/menaquinone biosynthesis C-methylase UbiE
MARKEPEEMPDTPQENTYVIDAESQSELVRLIEQDRMITRAMGALFPEPLDLSQIDSVLDLACGPGGWAQEVAFAHPEIEVTGVDLSQRMIGYAQVLARAQGLENINFQVMDITKPLAFADNSFDFVNARLLAGFMVKEAWPQLMQECVRITRPGGIICFTESDEGGISNSLASETMKSISMRALALAGKSLSPDGHNWGITPLLPRFLRNAGCQNIQERAFVLNFSYGTRAYQSNYENFKVAGILLQPFMVKMGVTTNEEWKQLYERMLSEMQEEDFCGLWYFLSAWGRKPQKA